MKAPNIETLIEKAKNLPPSPQILPKLLALLQDQNSTYWEIAKLIQLDQSLASQVLTWSNSGYYGYAEHSINIEEAIARVGLGEIYKLVGIVMSKRLLNQPSKFYALDPGQLWENSIAAAFSMEELALKIGEDTARSYTIGLMHGIGKIVINQACDCYEAVFKLVETKGYTLIDAEREVIGFHHAQVGEALLKKWDFPENVTEPIGFQYHPMGSKNFKKAASLMNVSHYVVSALGQNYGREAMAFAIDSKALDLVSISEEALQMLLIEVQERLMSIKSQLQIA